METHFIEQSRQEIIDQYGPWTAHNIHLGGGIYTISNEIAGDEIKLKRIVQIVVDLAGKPISELRILDLACLEGLYALEFAKHGAEVVGIEGRKENLAKAEFARDALELSRAEFFLDDVRNFSKEKYGEFDVILCLGILYHLDAPDVFEFMKNIAEASRRMVIFHTHVASAPKKTADFDGRTYSGADFTEYTNDPWASIGNRTSFWLTKPSLLNFLARFGFTSVYECSNPPEIQTAADRPTFVAVKGKDAPILTSPIFQNMPKEEWPEKSSRQPAYRSGRHRGLKYYFGRLRKYLTASSS